jgi:hypothetical protein
MAVCETMMSLLARNLGRRILVFTETYPFFVIGVIVVVRQGVLVVKVEEGVPIQLVGRSFRITLTNLVAFWIEDDEHPIPSLNSIKPTLSLDGGALDEDDADGGPSIRMSLKDLECRTILFVLLPEMLLILGQSFRPIMVARLASVQQDFCLLTGVNIRFSSAPEWIFPTPLYVPTDQIGVFLPFRRGILFPLTL